MSELKCERCKCDIDWDWQLSEMFAPPKTHVDLTECMSALQSRIDALTMPDEMRETVIEALKASIDTDEESFWNCNARDALDWLGGIK